MDKISVVIPAYNVEAYMAKCLDTVLGQTHKNLEVIVVNDGATDRTGEIIAQYASDPRLICINQQNAGVTAARNAGIEIATGDYITFVDSDDSLELDMYQSLYSALTRYNADVAACDYNLIYPDHTDYAYSDLKDEFVDLSAAPADYFYKYCACARPNNYIWIRLYKADIVKNSGVRFEQYELGDDTLFNFKLLPYIKSVANVSGGKYNYLQRLNSNVYTIAKRKNLATVYANTFEALAEHYEKQQFSAGIDALPVHAYTRLRSIVFYSKLAELSNEQIAANIKEGFAGRAIAKYLKQSDKIDRYAQLNRLSAEQADAIKMAMRLALENPTALLEMEIK